MARHPETCERCGGWEWHRSRPCPCHAFPGEVAPLRDYVRCPAYGPVLEEEVRPDVISW